MSKDQLWVVTSWLLADSRSAAVHKKTQTDRMVNTGEKQIAWALGRVHEEQRRMRTCF